jgi:hypothetical protein
MNRVHAGKEVMHKIVTILLTSVSIALVSSAGHSASGAVLETSAKSAPESASCPSGQCFADVPPDNPFYEFANRLYSQQIMSGYACGGPGEPCDSASRPYYRPGSSVTRGQMTKFIDNARRLPGISILANEPVVPISVTNTYVGGIAISGVSTTGVGVWGNSHNGPGLSGSSTNGDGVYGTSTNFEGVRGETASNYPGVFGRNTGTGSGPGVRGDANYGPGVYGLSSSYPGVWGKSAYNVGVKAESDSSVGMYAYTGGTEQMAIYGESPAGIGIYGRTNDVNSPAIEASNDAGGPGLQAVSIGDGPALVAANEVNEGYTGYAGLFLGNVHVYGSCCEAATGTFQIDDPLDPQNKYLSHAAVESPDMLDIYSGNTTTDASGKSIVTLPPYFESLNRDFRYQLTVVGQFAQAIVLSEIKDNSFEIETDKPSVKVSWQVTGVRHDPYAEQHPVVAEQSKDTGDRGKFLYPEAYGQLATEGINNRPRPSVVHP